jgi:excisionase family DNA binding protein
LILKRFDIIFELKRSFKIFAGEKTMPTYPENMNLTTAAKYLGVSSITVRRMLKDREIPAIKIRGRWLFKKTVIDDWLAKKLRQSLLIVKYGQSWHENGQIALPKNGSYLTNKLYLCASYGRIKRRCVDFTICVGF